MKLVEIKSINENSFFLEKKSIDFSCIIFYMYNNNQVETVDNIQTNISFLSRCNETKIAQYAPFAIIHVTIFLFSYFVTNDITVNNKVLSEER